MSTEAIIFSILFLVVGACFIVYFYLRSRERELIIQKGLTPEQMVSLFNRKKRYNPLLILKIGIVVLFFGFGLTSGLIIEEYMNIDGAVALTLFPFLGAGFIAAFFVGRKYEKNNKEDDQPTL